MEISTLSAIKTASSLGKALKEFAVKSRTEKVLNQLENHGVTLDEAKIKDPYYVGCLLRTLDAFERASIKEKLDVLVSFFTTCDNSGFIQQRPDFYQEILSLIDEMSIREMQILYMMESEGLPYIDDDVVKNPSNRNNCSQTYASILLTTSIKMKLSEDMLIALLVRLNRTGLLVTSVRWERNIYFFSPLFRDLKKFISINYYGL